jgi:hypothetical protein
VSEIERVLKLLDKRGTLSAGVELDAMRDAARLLRALAADFEKYATDHLHACALAEYAGIADAFTPCTCGLDAARDRWRLPR